MACPKPVYTAAMLRSLPLFGPLLLCLASACATTAPSQPAEQNLNASPACPAETHLSAVGESSQGRDAAVTTAKKNLLTQLGNTIHIQAESFSQLVNSNGKDSAEYRDVGRVLQNVDFSHAELIEIRDGAPRRNGQAVAVACMSRDAAVQALERDLTMEGGRFDSWDRTASEAQARGDRPAFVAALGNLSSVMASAAPKLVQIRALSGRPAPMEQHLTSRWQSLVKASDTLRGQIRFVLSLNSMERVAPITAQIAEAFRAALASLGSEVRLGEACPATASATYLVSVKADAECHLGSLGPTCRPLLDVRGQECKSGRQVFRSGLEHMQLSVVDARGEEQALRKMAQKLDPEKIRRELKAVMKYELPDVESR